MSIANIVALTLSLLSLAISGWNIRSVRRCETMLDDIAARRRARWQSLLYIGPPERASGTWHVDEISSS